MDRQQFLDRVIAPGSFLAIAAKAATGHIFHKFFERSNVRGADRFLDWAVRHNMDVWHAIASYSEATHQSDDKYMGRRTQQNVEAVKTFFLDADIARPGDGKDPAKVFASQADVVSWVAQFCRATGVPRPNLWVVSGYGLHVYWTLRDALNRSEWQTAAEQFKAMLIAHGARGDTSIVADAARILRPVDTFNHKLAAPAPVYEFLPDQLTRADLETSTMLGAIGSLAPASGPSSAFPVGRRMTENARSGLNAKPRDFELIARQCGQVARSLIEGGEHDSRQLWHALVSLTHFCEDGRRYAHAIGCAHRKYSEADTDKEFDLVGTEHQHKPFGAPLCTTLADYSKRPEICAGCPHRGHVTSPFSLGVKAAAPDELPSGYRRESGRIERRDAEGKWFRVIDGDLATPRLERVDRHYRLTFDYLPPSKPSITVQVENVEIEPRTAKALFSQRGVHLSVDATPHFVRLIMAWIDQLQRATKTIPRAELIPHFGWYRNDAGALLGLAVGGTLYRNDGREEVIPGGDPVLINHYQPAGSLRRWQQAAELVIDGCPELQIALGLSFGGPLMEFADQPCICISSVGPSGCGKSSAFKAGAGIWGHPIRTMAQLDDTSNYLSKRIGDVGSLPAYWDEVKITDRYKTEELKRLLHKLTQGRDKARLTATVEVRETGEWKTLFAFASNDSLISRLSGLSGDNSATLLRMLEIPVSRTVDYDVEKGHIVGSVDNNYGHAGREFAKYVVQHVDQITKLVQYLKVQLSSVTHATNDERFYIAGGAAILAGAAIAGKLQLVKNFDLTAMQNVIVNAIIAARITRGEYAPTDPIEVARNALSRFCNEHIERRIVTRSIPTSGAHARHVGDRFVVRPPIAGMGALAFQVGLDDGVLRFNRDLWTNWCHKYGLSPDLLDGTGWTLNRVTSRAKLGANTDYATERMKIVELNLKLPELAHYTEGYQSLGAPPAGNVVPLRPTP